MDTWFCLGEFLSRTVPSLAQPQKQIPKLSTIAASEQRETWHIPHFLSVIVVTERQSPIMLLVIPGFHNAETDRLVASRRTNHAEWIGLDRSSFLVWTRLTILDDDGKLFVRFPDFADRDTIPPA